MSYHNKRDSKGRFAPKDSSSSPTKRTKSTKVEREVYDIVLLDESSSMGGSRGLAAVKGFNSHVQSMIETADKVKINTTASLYIFNHNCRKERNFAHPSSFPKLDYTQGSYYPSGSTALYKTVADAINEVVAYLSSKGKLGSKDVDVTITMFTDGEDTASQSSLEAAKKAINTAMNEYKWTIAFIGAGEVRSLQAEAMKMGIHPSNVLVVNGTEEGVNTAYDTLRSSRMNKTLSYSSTGVSDNIGFFQK
jgi:hypothetical protein